MSLIVGAVESVAAWTRVCLEGAECDILDADLGSIPGAEVPKGGAALPVMASLPAGSTPEDFGRFLASPLSRSVRYARIHLADLARMTGARAEAERRGFELVARVDYASVPTLRRMTGDEVFASNLGARRICVAYKASKVADLDAGLNFLATARMPASVSCRGRLGAASRVLFAGGGSDMVWGAVGPAPDSEGRVSVRVLRELSLQLSACA